MPVIQSAPVLHSLKSSGGTFYTFSSTNADFSYLFSDSNVRIAPSKFVAIKLPQWSNTTNQSMFVDPAAVGAPVITDPNDVFPKILQNYVENLIQISEANKIDNTLANYAGPAFWKMLRKMGSMAIEPSGSTVVEDGLTKVLYKERANSAVYDRVVKFVGDINMLNHVKDGANEYLEIFAHIPTESGRQEDILFKQGSNRHVASMIPVGSGPNITSGLDAYNNIANVKAMYDNDGTKQYEVGSDLQDSDVFFDDITSNYEAKSKKGNFDFNALLLYYDIFDKNDGTKLARNLYGILLIENFDNNVAGNGEIPSFTKFQPSSTQSGNAYSFRMNLKFSNASNQVTSEITVNDYSTVSMELYMNALKRMHNATTTLEKSMELVQRIKDASDRLVSTSLNADRVLKAANTIESIDKRLQKIETSNTEVGQKISNEELFRVFSKTISAIQDAKHPVNITNVVSDKLALGKLLQDGKTGDVVIEINNVMYKWSIATKQWVETATL